MAGRNKVADGIKVDSQVQEIILHYLSGPAYSQRPLKVDSVGEGEGGKIWENGIEACKISCMK